MMVSVAIVTRDRSKSLLRCLQSLSRQTVLPSEVVIVDTPLLSEIAFVGNLPLRYVVEERIGIAHARNRALKEVKGEILAFIDDDCEAFPNWVERHVYFHTKYKQAIAVQGWSVSRPKNTPISIVVEHNHRCGFSDQILVNGGRRDTMQRLFEEEASMTAFYTKNVSLKMDFIRRERLEFNTFLPRYEDVDFAKQLLSHGKNIVFCPSARVYHWERPTLDAFFMQRFTDGQGKARIHMLWPKEYFPRPSRYWWAKRILDFFSYCLRHEHSVRAPVLMLLFVAEKLVFLLGFLYERLRLWGSAPPRNLQKARD